jgi:hemolysin activation/secretion protein
MVTENRPWSVYAQISNTGTESTNEWRERFGFVHNQLTGHDDILRLDYVTGNFQDVHGFYGEYGGPVWRVPRLRWRLDGSWSQYDASEVGVQELDFGGDQWHTGGRLQANLFQHREIFIDAFAGTQWQRIGVRNDTTGDETDNFFMPEVGVYAERVGEVWSFALETAVDHNFGELADTNEDTAFGEDELELLGGDEDAKSDFTRFKWQGDLSFYPFPLLRRLTWFSESELGAYDYAQEIALVTQGQASFGEHLVPQLQQVVGGLYTVRGYDQSATAGDTVAIGSLEYRLHLPRLLWPSAEDAIPVPVIGRFRYRPENAFSFPDWDLIAKVFVDAAYVDEHGTVPLIVGPGDPPEDEQRHSDLIHSFGFGAELRVLRVLSARLDVAWPQRRFDDNDPGLNKPKLHGVVTLYY